MTKPIQIKREDIVEDIRELASLTGEPITDAVGVAVRSRLEEVRRRTRAQERRAEIDRLLAEFQALVAGKPVPTDDDFYDEYGLPK